MTTALVEPELLAIPELEFQVSHEAPQQVQLYRGPMDGAVVPAELVLEKRYVGQITWRQETVGKEKLMVNLWGNGRRRVEYVEDRGRMVFSRYLQ